MSIRSIPNGLYPIVDVTHCPNLSLYTACEELLAAGCAWLELRAKTSDEAAFLREAAKVAYLKIHNPFLLIVNHSVDIAEKIGADGVHLTAKSVAVGEARARLGPSAMIGYSAHSLDEALRAEQDGADYVSLGAVFPTPYKSPDHPIHGPEGLWRVVERLQIPVIAVGGIDAAKIPLLVNPNGKKQVHGFSVIRAILESQDRAQATRALQDVWAKSILVARGDISH